jgi:hypothetical protein
MVVGLGGNCTHRSRKEGAILHPPQNGRLFFGVFIFIIFPKHQKISGTGLTRSHPRVSSVLALFWKKNGELHPKKA